MIHALVGAQKFGNFCVDAAGAPKALAEQTATAGSVRCCVACADSSRPIGICSGVALEQIEGSECSVRLDRD
jgi:hypothetical protein